MRNARRQSHNNRIAIVEEIKVVKRRDCSFANKGEVHQCEKNDWLLKQSFDDTFIINYTHLICRCINPSEVRSQLYLKQHPPTLTSIALSCWLTNAQVQKRGDYVILKHILSNNSNIMLFSLNYELLKNFINSFKGNTIYNFLHIPNTARVGSFVRIIQSIDRRISISDLNPAYDMYLPARSIGHVYFNNQIVSSKQNTTTETLY